MIQMLQVFSSRHLRTCCFLIIIHSIIVLPSSASEPVYHPSFQKLLKQMAAQNPRLQVQKLQIDNQTLETKNTTKALIPSLDAVAEAGAKGSSVQARSNPLTATAGLVLQQTLYDNGVMWVRREIAQKALMQAQLQQQIVQDEILFQFFQVYLDYVRVKINHEQEKSLFERMQKYTRETKLSYFQGVKKKQDYYRFLNREKQSLISLRSLERQFKVAEANLMTMLDAKEKLELAPWGLNDLLPSPPPSTSSASPKPSLPQDGQAMNLKLRIAQLDVEIAQLEKQIISKKLWPELSINLNGQYGTPDYLASKSVSSAGDSSKSQWSWGALAGLKFNLFDGGLRTSQEKIAINAHAMKEKEAELKRRETELQELNLKEQRVQVLADIQDMQELYKQEKDVLSDIENDYRGGRITGVGLLDEFAIFSKVQRELFETAAQYWKIHYELLSLKGVLHDQWLQTAAQ